MSPPSILFGRSNDRTNAQRAAAPDFFVDLNLDQVVAAATAAWADYDLKPFFYFSLSSVDAIIYRHEVFQDLERASLLNNVRWFAHRMREIREHLTKAQKLYYRYQKEAWFLQAAGLYCEGIRGFAECLATERLGSRGFCGFRQYLTSYAGGDSFTSFVQETAALASDLSKVRYCLLVNGNAFTVQHYDAETDYSAEIEETFAKFNQGAVRDYRIAYRPSDDMNHIEAKALEFVAQLYPEVFARLDDYCRRHARFIDDAIAGFDREIHFYVAYIEHIEKFERAGLRFCYPEVSLDSKEVHDREGFDLALAEKMIAAKASIVCNDFFLQGRERIIVVTGPNQGGKTTFARMFGQLHYLASLGCPVPGRDARLFLFDHLFTHFEREEKVESLRGKLQDDLMRVHAILAQATPGSIVIMNEIFTSTTIQDEIFLGRRVMETLRGLDLLCVWVTFVDELSTLSDSAVSMVSTVFPENPALRTFKIARRPADGRAHALAIAEKYQLSYTRVKERISS